MGQTVPSITDHSSRANLIAPLVLFVAALAFYSINLNHLPHPDELHHVIAAHGLLTTGEPQIAEGLYTRVLLHTWMVAKSYQLFGESIAAARVPSVVALAACVALLFVWVRQECGSRAAWWSAVLFGASPFAVGVAQFVRFYALQTLVFTATAMVAYYAVAGRQSLLVRAGLAVVALPLLAFGTYLQPTTLMGAVALLVWALPALFLPWLLAPEVPRARKLVVVGGSLAAGLVVIAGLSTTGVLGELWQRYREAPLFIGDRVNNFWYYHAWLNLLYPTLWPAVGILALVTIVVHPTLGSFAAVTFAVSFLLNSFAASKGMRYMVYAQPELFIIWGVAIAALWPQLTAVLCRLRTDLAQRLDAYGASANLLGTVLVAGAIAFLLLANPTWLRSITMLADIAVPPEQPHADWPRAKDSLMPWITSADVVVSTEELGTLYYLGRYDIRFSPSKLEELAPDQQREFGRDYRTGRPVIGERETLMRLIDCYRTGIVLGPATHWGAPHLIDSKTLALIESNTVPLELPPRTQIRAQVWNHGAIWTRPADCADMQEFSKELLHIGSARSPNS